MRAFPRPRDRRLRAGRRPDRTRQDCRRAPEHRRRRRGGDRCRAHDRGAGLRRYSPPYVAGILRNVLPDGSLDDYIATVQKTFGANYAPDDVYAGDYFSALGAIDSGVTCILDWSHIHNTPAHTDAAIKALMDSGVRAVFAYGNAQTTD